MNNHTPKSELFLKWGSYVFAAALAVTFIVMGILRIMEHRHEARAMAMDSVWNEYLTMSERIAANPDSSTSMTDSLMQFDNDNPQSTYLHGNILFSMGKYEKAAEQYRHVVDLDPDGKWADPARYSLAYCMENLGRNDESERMFTESVPDDSALGTRDYFIAGAQRCEKRTKPVNVK